MSDKPVTDLAGIGEVIGSRLSAKGFDKVKIFYCSPKICGHFCEIHEKFVKTFGKIMADIWELSH
jgi:hypothetical protein